MTCCRRGKRDEWLGELDLAGNLGLCAGWVGGRNDDTEGEEREVEEGNLKRVG